jgi:hypothetical protein
MREPATRRIRLTTVRFLAVVLGSILLGPAAAAGAAQTPVTIAIAAGVSGYVHPQRPVEVSVTISSDVLISGTLQVKLRDSTVDIPVEVPAAGVKTYTSVVPAPLAREAVRVRLLVDGQVVADESTQLKVPEDETLVGVVGAPELDGLLKRVESIVTERPVVPIDLAADSLDGYLDPIAYLVLADPVELPPSAVRWLHQGGRLVIESDSLSRIGIDPGAGDPQAEADATIYRVGQGEVITVAAIGAIDAEQWAEVLRPSPVEVAFRDSWQTPDQQLMSSATAATDQRVPELPWLLAAVVLLAVVLGPVNMLVLKRFHRRELAWITIPAISLLALAGFWVAGRQRLETNVMNHATVLVGTGDALTAQTALVLASGGGGHHEIGLPADWRAYPGGVTDMSGVLASPSATKVGPTSMEFDLGELESAGLQASWPGPAVALPTITTELQEGGNGIEVTVANTSPWDLWAWGVVRGGQVDVALQPLATGEEGTVTTSLIPNMMFSQIGDAVMQSRQPLDDLAWQRYNGLSTAAAALAATNGEYVFAYVEDLKLDLQLDGAPRQVSGWTLILVPLEYSSNRAAATVVDAGSPSYVERGAGYVNFSTDEITMSFHVPAEAGNPTLSMQNFFGQFPGKLEAYNWATSTYESVEVGASLDATTHRSSSGEYLLRALAQDPDNPDPGMFEMMFTPMAFSLDWGAAG